MTVLEAVVEIEELCVDVSVDKPEADRVDVADEVAELEWLDVAELLPVVDALEEAVLVWVEDGDVTSQDRKELADSYSARSVLSAPTKLSQVVVSAAGR